MINWDRIDRAREIIDRETSCHAGYATLSSRTSAGEGLLHWRTAESVAELMPRTYKIYRAPGGDRRIHNIKIRP